MPGFNIGNGDPEAREPRNTAETRRKHRWVFEVLEPVNEGLVFLQKAARPTFKYTEAVMHHDQEQAYFAGKQDWDPITLTFYDVEQPPDVSARLFAWVQTVTTGGLNSAGGTVTVAPPSAYKKQAELSMRDGAGQATERWALKGVWPQQTNWMDLDYTNSDIQLIEVTMRFDRAVRDITVV